MSCAPEIDPGQDPCRETFVNIKIQLNKVRYRLQISTVRRNNSLKFYCCDVAAGDYSKFTLIPLGGREEQKEKLGIVISLSREKVQREDHGRR